MASTTRRTMRLLSEAVVLGSVAAAACFDSPAASPVGPVGMIPAASAPLASKGDKPAKPVLAEGLLRVKPLAEAVSVTKEISSAKGGVIRVSDADFELRIPAGAFADPRVRLTVTAIPGSIVAYDFQPHGMVFLKPLTFVQKLGHTNWKEPSKRANFTPAWNGGYFADPSQLNENNGTARVDELIPADLNTGSGTFTFPIPHFSGYMASSGRH